MSHVFQELAGEGGMIRPKKVPYAGTQVAAKEAERSE